MAFNLDIIEQIGSFCDNATYFNLCLADKAYYETQQSLIRDITKAKIIQQSKDNIDMCHKAFSPYSRLKYIHKQYRFMLKHPKFLQRHRQLIEVMLVKLEELRTPHVSGLRMGVAPYRKYHKALLAL